MEIQLRIVMLVLGLLILFGVAIDFYRRRPLRQSADRETQSVGNNDLLNAISGGKHYHAHQASLSNTEAYKYDTDLYHNSVEPELDFIDDEISYNPRTDIELIDDLENELDQLDQLDKRDNYIHPEYIDPQYVDSDHIEPAYTEEPEPKINANDVLAVFIMSRDPIGFDGDELYTALSNANFYLGKNDVFYRYSNDDGTGEHLFTLVKAVEPGYFNISNLRNEQVPGITLLMLPSQLSSPLVALDKLVRAAKQIAFVLNGELLDSSRQPLTLSTIDEYKAKINAT